MCACMRVRACVCLMPYSLCTFSILAKESDLGMRFHFVEAKLKRGFFAQNNGMALNKEVRGLFHKGNPHAYLSAFHGRDGNKGREKYCSSAAEQNQMPSLCVHPSNKIKPVDRNLQLNSLIDRLPSE